MTPVGFEPTISVAKRPQTYALDGAATGTVDESLLSEILMTPRCKSNDLSLLHSSYHELHFMAHSKA